jgi:hypothetical protein
METETQQTQTKKQEVFYLKPLVSGDEQLVDWPMFKGLGERGARLARPVDFEVGQSVMYEATTDEDFEQESGTVLALNAMVVRLGDGRLASIEWDSGHLTYIG